MNLLSEYIATSWQDKIALPLLEEEEKKWEAALKTVTVRLDKDTLQTADNIAKYLEVSRQKFLAIIIESGVNDAFRILAEARLFSHGVMSEKCTEEEWGKHVESERTQLIKELCA